MGCRRVGVRDGGVALSGIFQWVLCWGERRGLVEGVVVGGNVCSFAGECRYS